MVLGKYFRKYYIKYGIFFLLGALSLVLVDYFQLKIPKIIGDIIDLIENNNLTNEVLKNYVIDLIIVAVVVFTGRFVWRVCIFGNGIKIEADIRNRMFAKMEKLSVRYYSENKTGALMALYTNDLTMIRSCFASGTLMLVDALALGILTFTKMINLSVVLTLICLVPLVCVCVFAIFMQNRIAKKSEKNLEAYSNLSDFVQEDFSGIGVIKAYVREKIRIHLFKRYNDDNMITCLNKVKENVFVQIIINLILSVITIVIIFYGGYFVYTYQNGTSSIPFTIGQLTEFNSYFGSLIWPIMAVGELINLKSQAIASEKRITKLFDEKEEIKDKTDIIDKNIQGSIEYRDLSFAYPNASVNILSHVSFKIDQGEIVGIMGGTGSGKSTIVELLLRLYNIEENRILIDGVDIMNLPINKIRNSIAYVPQETFLFKQTIDENISFSNSSVDEAKTHKAAYQSGISTDIEGFKDKYQTILGERGVNVSGGQKQRIAIARALIKDAPILILDDSLSAVDTFTENHILHELREIRKNKTTIIIAHRITTLEGLDKIIVVNDGKIDGIGKHNELLETNEIYKREVRLQELEKEMGA